MPVTRGDFLSSINVGTKVVLAFSALVISLVASRSSALPPSTSEQGGTPVIGVEAETSYWCAR